MEDYCVGTIDQLACMPNCTEKMIKKANLLTQVPKSNIKILSKLRHGRQVFVVGSKYLLDFFQKLIFWRSFAAHHQIQRILIHTCLMREKRQWVGWQEQQLKHFTLKCGTTAILNSLYNNNNSVITKTIILIIFFALTATATAPSFSEAMNRYYFSIEYPFELTTTTTNIEE